jgi:hypothetical protein
MWVTRPTLICLNRGDFGQSSVRQFGPLDAMNPSKWGIIAEGADDHHIAERVFYDMAEDLQSRGVCTHDGTQRIFRLSPIGGVGFPELTYQALGYRIAS